MGYRDRSDQSPVKGEISFKEIIAKTEGWLSYLGRKWKFILLFAFVSGLSGVCYSIFSKPTYNGVLNFVLADNGKSDINNYSSIAAELGFNIGGGSSGIFQEYENIIAFMKSRTILVKTLLTKDTFDHKRQFLADRYLDITGLRNDWRKDGQLSALRFHPYHEYQDLLEDSVLNFLCDRILKENLSVEKPQRKNDIIVISTQSTDQLFSKSFSENLLENVSEFYIKGQIKKSEENVAILKHQVDSVYNLLNNAISGAAISIDANPNPNPAFQRLRVPSEKKMVDVEMNKAILEELIKNLKLSEISLRKETPLVQIIDRPILPLKSDKVGKLKSFCIGAFLGALFMIMYLSIKLVYKQAQKEA